MNVQNLTAVAFQPYGTVIQIDETKTEGFQVIVEEPEAEGWRIAISQLTRGKIVKLGLHPNTRESFEPLSGISLILVAKKEAPQELEVFLLDQPVCLHKNIWHATAALSSRSLIKITENNHVESMEYVLDAPLDFCVKPIVSQ